MKNIFSVLFHYFPPFFKQLHNSILPKLLYFGAKSCSRCLLQSSRELEFFPLRGLHKDWNKLRSEGAISREYVRWIRTSKPCYNSFCLVFKETCSFPLSWWNIMGFLFFFFILMIILLNVYFVLYNVFFLTFIYLFFSYMILHMFYVH